MVFNHFVTPSVWEHVDGSSAIDAGFHRRVQGHESMSEELDLSVSVKN